MFSCWKGPAEYLKIVTHWGVSRWFSCMFVGASRITHVISVYELGYIKLQHVLTTSKRFHQQKIWVKPNFFGRSISVHRFIRAATLQKSAMPRNEFVPPKLPQVRPKVARQSSVLNEICGDSTLAQIYASMFYLFLDFKMFSSSFKWFLQVLH